MGYRILKGVVYTKVCGESMLVASRPAWGRCPYTRFLSALWGAFWQGISMNYTEDDIVQELVHKTNIKEAALRSHFRRFIQTMTEEGYLTKC